jgi:hypothetical protein
MAFKNLASFPQKYMDAWMEFVQDPSFKIYVPTESEATGLKLRLYQFRRRFQLEAGGGMEKTFDSLELTTSKDDKGHFVGLFKDGWADQVDANRRRRNGNDETP